MLKQQINPQEFVENIYNFFSLEKDKEQSYICSDITWNEYESILDTLSDNSWCKISYLDGVLKLVSPSKNHEIAKGKIRALLEAYCDYLEIDYFAMGSTTLKQKDKSSGKESDKSYCFNILKDIPDLAIEVVESSGSLEDLEKYLRLSVKEVWFLRMETLPFRELVPHLRWQQNRLEVSVNQGDRYIQQTTSSASLK